MKVPEKYIKISSYISLVLLIILLVPLMIMGFFTHPVGDDYLYGEFGAAALRESGNFFSVFAEAFKGMLEQYRIWQGTYSAMFLMYLPPNLFGDFFYKLYPSVILLCLCGSLFFMLKPVINGFLKCSNHAWIAVSSVLSILFIEQVPLCGETFYWYNGSMYYTGFLAATFFFFGLVFRFIQTGKKGFIAPLILLAFFIAGGNYASLLPAMIIVFVLVVFLFIKKDTAKAVSLLVVFVTLLIGLIISVLAPGNAVRAAESVGTSPVKAIAKSILQCGNYTLCWSGIPVFLGFLALTPVFADIAKKSDLKFKFLPALIPFAFLVFASSETAVFYGQNNGGPARLFDICFYMMILTEAFIYFIIVNLFVIISAKSAGKTSSHEASESAIRETSDGKTSINDSSNPEASESGIRETSGGKTSINDSSNPEASESDISKIGESGPESSASVKSCMIKSLIVLCVIFAITIPLSFIKKSYVSLNSVTAAVSLVNSDAAYYESQYSERMALISENPGGDLVFKTYDVPENLNHFLFVGDISDDPSHFVNMSFARFHNINSVHTSD